MNADMVEAARTALRQCMGLGRGEQMLVVCDPPCLGIGAAILAAGRELCREALMVQTNPRRQHGSEPPEPVGAWFRQFDVVVMSTSMSLSHTCAPHPVLDC